MRTNYRDPFSSLMELQKAFDSALENPFFGNSISARGAYPPVNVFEDENGDKLVLFSEIPGADKSKLSINYHNKTLTIEGEIGLSLEKENESRAAHRLERKKGKFSRSISLPFHIKADKIDAQYNDGILTISMSKAEEEKPKKISIQ